MKVLLDLLVTCVLGDSVMVLIMAALLVIAVMLVVIATRLAQGATPGTRRSAVELMVLITLTEGPEPESFVFVVQSRPGQTRSDLLELIRDELPARLREAAITYWSAEPNVISPARKALSASARPADIQALTRASATAAARREIPASAALPRTRGGAR